MRSEKDPVDPGQHDVGDAGGAGIARATIGLGSGAGGEGVSEKGMKAGGRIIRDLAEADAPGAAATILDLDGADNQHFPLMAASAAAGDRIVFAAAAPERADFPHPVLHERGSLAAA